jgi:hypothetical protein
MRCGVKKTVPALLALLLVLLAGVVLLVHADGMGTGLGLGLGGSGDVTVTPSACSAGYDELAGSDAAVIKDSGGNPICCPQ